jgi:cytoskeletal protein CcmA (bactofilin family)
MIKKFGLSSNKRKTRGVMIDGNLEMDGNIKASGFYLSDKSRPNQVAKVALPSNVYYKNSKIGINNSEPKASLDIKGNLHVNEQIIGRDVIAKSLKSDKETRLEGKTSIDGETNFKGNVNFMKPSQITITNSNGKHTHFNFKNKSENHISGKTYLSGEVIFNSSNKFEIKNQKSGLNPNGESTIFNDKGGLNKIYGNTILNNGAVINGKSQLEIKNPKNNNNIEGKSTFFNYNNKSENYIRGKTSFDGRLHIDGNTDIKGDVEATRICLRDPKTKKIVCIDNKLFDRVREMEKKVKYLGLSEDEKEEFNCDKINTDCKEDNCPFGNSKSDGSTKVFKGERKCTENLQNILKTGKYEISYTINHSKPGEEKKPSPTPQKPTCAIHEGTVWAMCGDKPFKKWGTGPEGQEQALKNCTYSYTQGGNKDKRCPATKEPNQPNKQSSNSTKEVSSTLRRALPMVKP